MVYESYLKHLSSSHQHTHSKHLAQQMSYLLVLIIRSYREVKILSRYLHIPQGSTLACSHTNIVQSTDLLSSLASEDSENKFALKH